MAHSKVSVTEGSGKNLNTWDRTISSVLVQDQAMVLDEPFGASYVVASGSSSAATSTSHWQLMAGSTLNVYLRRVWVYQTVVATTAALVPWTLQRLTSAGTTGTAATPAPYDTADAASGATFLALPSSKGTESGVVVGTQYGYMTQTLPTSVLPAPAVLAFWDWSGVARSKCPRIAAGTSNGIAVSNRAAVAGASVVVVIEFTELSY